MKFSTTAITAMLGVAAAAPASVQKRSNTIAKRQVPQEQSHGFVLAITREFLNLNNPKGIVDPVFGLLGDAAAKEGAGKVTNLDCLKQETADQAFTNAKAAGDLRGMAGALLFQAIERNTGKVGQASVLCKDAAVNPEIAALTQHQDAASANAAAINKEITLELARQLAAIGADPDLALLSGTFAPGDVNDATGAGNTCDTEDAKLGCIFTEKLLVLDASQDEITKAVAGVAQTFTGTGGLTASDLVNFADFKVAQVTGKANLADFLVAPAADAADAATTTVKTGAAAAPAKTKDAATTTVKTGAAAAPAKTEDAAAVGTDSQCIIVHTTIIADETAAAEHTPAVTPPADNKAEEEKKKAEEKAKAEEKKKAQEEKKKAQEEKKKAQEEKKKAQEEKKNAEEKAKVEEKKKAQEEKKKAQEEKKKAQEEKKKAEEKAKAEEEKKKAEEKATETPAAAHTPAATTAVAAETPAAETLRTVTRTKASSTAAAAATHPAAVDATATNIQAFTGALGGPAPPVESDASSNRPFTVNGNTFTTEGAAITRSCDIQNNACFNAVNSGQLAGNTAQCAQQLDQCKSANNL